MTVLFVIAVFCVSSFWDDSGVHIVSYQMLVFKAVSFFVQGQ